MGKSFKFIKNLRKEPEITYVLETWLKPTLDFVKEYNELCRDRREGSGGGCVTFLNQVIQYRVLTNGTQLEYIIIEN